MLLPGQARVIVAASLPTNPSHDVTLKIPIQYTIYMNLHIQEPLSVSFIGIILSSESETETVHNQ